ncbi:MAG: hypothetical protein ACI4JK_11560 [Oscillospiraceae bacterium]
MLSKHIRHFQCHGKVSADTTDVIMKRLKFDNDTRNNVVQLVFYHDATFEVGRKYVKRWLNKIGEKQFHRLIDVRRADVKGQKSDYDKDNTEKIDTIEKLIDEVLQENQCFTIKDPAVTGRDLMQIGFKPDKELGETLNMLLNGVINEEFENSREVLLEIAKKKIHK